jgi:eukaryotic-like serine/threonine-protein kinase
MGTSPRSDRWVRIEYLFYAALELEPNSRAAFLDQACRDDAELRKEVESLLRMEGQTMDFLRKPCTRRRNQIAGGSLSGKRIGAYQLLRLLGEGGMGKVYLAARADDLYRKEVAIKTVQGGLGQNPAMLLRFRSERQILANLDHPAIARLLDGGITDDGLPYLVMEYVNGIRVDDYCRINKLGTEQRLKLVLRRVRRRGVRPQKSRGPSRYQARQHPSHRGRPSQAVGFRHCQANRSRGWATSPRPGPPNAS